MRVFFDFEFTGLHQMTTPISLGLVPEEGKAAYFEFTDYDESQVDDWLRENVIAHLSDKIGPSQDPGVSMYIRSTHLDIPAWVKSYLSQWDSVEMWGDVLAYDWVLFCQLFNNKLPDNIYYIPFDIATLMKIKGVDPDASRAVFSGLTGLAQHNALADARTIAACYKKLTEE